MKRIGLIINPVAGIGGKVGLKGSDGEATVQKALALGAKRESGAKALTALLTIKASVPDVEVYTCGGEMGAAVCARAGLKTVVIDPGQLESAQVGAAGNKKPAASTSTAVAGSTSAADTIRAARELLQYNLALLLFAGGDGTARNILDAVGSEVLVLGIPAGCKIHSGVYALNPRDAGLLAVKVLEKRIVADKQAEVMDIDETLFRQNIVQAKLYGYLKIPDDSAFMQVRKSGAAVAEGDAVAAGAAYLAETMEPDTLYIIGTGSTTAAVMQELGLPNTLLGVDLVYNRKVLASDCTEKEILTFLAKYPKAKIIATVIGGQGYVFGRGNQQLSAAVLKIVGKENIKLIATKQKLAGLPQKRLYVDTGDDAVNKLLSGYIRVVVGYQYEVLMTIGC